MLHRAFTEIYEVMIHKVIVQIFGNNTREVDINHTLQVWVIVIERLDVEHAILMFVTED